VTSGYPSDRQPLYRPRVLSLQQGLFEGDNKRGLRTLPVLVVVTRGKVTVTQRATSPTLSLSPLPSPSSTPSFPPLLLHFYQGLFLPMGFLARINLKRHDI